MKGLTTPHPYPGKLIIVEGIDGSGKSTQISLRHRWLLAYQARIHREYDRMTAEFEFVTVDAQQPVEDIQQELRTTIGRYLAGEVASYRKTVTRRRPSSSARRHAGRRR